MKKNIRWVRNRKEIISIFVFFFLFCFLIVLQRNNTTNLRYEITELEGNLKKEKAVKADLTIEIVRLSTPERIEALAKFYGLVSVKPDQIVFLSDVNIPVKEEKEREESWGFLARLFERNIEAKEKW